MTKIYIAGPMRGYDELNFPAFNAAAYDLTADGYIVVNPVDINPDPNADWLDCMRKDIKALVDCDAIYMLEGWEKSGGATIEHFIASRLGFDVYYEVDDLNDAERTDTE